MKEIHVGVIGVGLVGYVHLMSLLTLIESRIFSDKAIITVDAICDINAKQAADIKNTFHIPKS